MKDSKLLKGLAVVSLAVLTSAGFAAIQETTTTTTNQVVATQKDAGVLNHIIAIDQNEVLAGIDASHKASNSDVVDYAKMMVNEHGTNMVKALSFAGKQAKPSKDLQAKGEKVLVSLTELQGIDYDRAYIANMIKGHQEALNLIDNKLLKNAKTDDVKTFLTDTRNSVAKHLDEAKQIQNNLQS